MSLLNVVPVVKVGLIANVRFATIKLLAGTVVPSLSHDKVK